MSAASSPAYRFALGACDCLVISDGCRAQPWSAVVASGPAGAQEPPSQDGTTPPTEQTVPSSCLLIETGRQRVLVDTGAGPLVPGAGRLMDNLRAQGIAPEAIDTVVLSHAHPGHIGGALGRDGRPAFPGARYVLWREEWDFWTAQPDLHTRGMQWLAEAARASLLAIQQQVELVDRDAEIAPGMCFVAAPGHTAGHAALLIGAAQGSLLYLADSVFHPLHLERPQWYSPFDLRPEQSVNSRIRLLDRAVAEGTLVHAPHIPFPGLGRVIPRGDAWQWQPLEIAPAQVVGAPKTAPE